MQTTEVKPPAAAARVPVAMVSLADWPGSRRCTCRSINPGAITSPRQSISSTPLSGGRIAGAAMRPSMMARSPVSSR